MADSPERDNPLGGNIPGRFRLHSDMSTKYESLKAELLLHGMPLADAQIVFFKDDPVDGCTIAGSDSAIAVFLSEALEQTEHHPSLLYFDVHLFKDGSPPRPLGGTGSRHNRFVVITGSEMPPKMFYAVDEGVLVDPARYEEAEAYMLTNAEADAISKLLIAAKPESYERHLELIYG